MFTGCGTALVTPFKSDLSLDVAATAAAGPAADPRRHRLSGAVRDHGREPDADARRASAGGARSRWKKLARPAEKCRCWPAAGGYNTAEVIELAKELQLLGVDGLLSVTPYYNKATQDGLYQHYKAIADAVQLPIVVYNVPGRTGVNVETGDAQAPVGNREHLWA